MSNLDQVRDISEGDDEELSSDDVANASGGATLSSGTSLKVGGIGTTQVAGRTQITTDEVGDVDQ